jgi:hypothetical protein
VPEKPQNVTLKSEGGQVLVKWDAPRLFPGPANYSVHVLFWDGCPDIPGVTCDCKKTKAGNDKMVVSGLSPDEQARREAVMGKDRCVLDGSTYMIQVQATTAAGPGPLSAPMNVSTVVVAAAVPTSESSDHEQRLKEEDQETTVIFRQDVSTTGVGNIGEFCSLAVIHHIIGPMILEL